MRTFRGPQIQGACKNWQYDNCAQTTVVNKAKKVSALCPILLTW